MANVEVKSYEVLTSRVHDETDYDLQYDLEARRISEFGTEKWLVGQGDVSFPWFVYPDEIDAYIDLFTAMKDYKEEK